MGHSQKILKPRVLKPLQISKTDSLNQIHLKEFCLIQQSMLL